MGKGHCEYGFGVPERVLAQKKGELRSCIVSTREWEKKVEIGGENEKFEFLKDLGNEIPADFVYFYEENKE